MKRLLTLFAAAALACAAALPAQAQTDNALTVSCENSELEVLADSPNVRLRCEASGLPEGEKYVYEWLEKVKGEWNHAVNLTNRHSAKPKFIVPKFVSKKTKYEFLFTARSQDRLQHASTYITVITIRHETSSSGIKCKQPYYPVHEGSAPIPLDCTGIIKHNKNFSFRWEARGDTPNTDRLSATYLLNPSFNVPVNVDKKTRYRYTLNILQNGTLIAKRKITITVLNKPATEAYDIVTPFTHTYNEEDSTVTITGAVQAKEPYLLSWFIIRKPAHAYGGKDGIFDYALDNENDYRMNVNGWNAWKIEYSGHLRDWCRPLHNSPDDDIFYNDPKLYIYSRYWSCINDLENVGATAINHFTYDVYLVYYDKIKNKPGRALLYSFSPLGPVNTSNRVSDPEGPSVEMLTQLAEGSAAQAAEELPGAVALEQNYPNPFNPSTAIEYALPEAAHVRLDVFDVSGRNVIVLVDGTRPAGTHTARFDAGGLPSGLYVYRLQAGGNTIVKTMHLIR